LVFHNSTQRDFFAKGEDFRTDLKRLGEIWAALEGSDEEVTALPEVTGLPDVSAVRSDGEGRLEAEASNYETFSGELTTSAAISLCRGLVGRQNGMTGWQLGPCFMPKKQDIG